MDQQHKIDVFSAFPSRPLERESVLTIGNFDGVHCGHQMLIEQVIQRAQSTGRASGVITFDPHPLAVLRPDLPLSMLTTPQERQNLLCSLGVDFVVTLNFTPALAATSARDFASALVSRLRMAELWVGHDFALGRKREGDVPTLRKLGEELGFRVETIENFSLPIGPVRSTRIRELLNSGDVTTAAILLGRLYELDGVVVKGDQRGRLLGFPTANLEISPNKLVPARGVYAVWADVAGSQVAGVTNIGVRPTIAQPEPQLTIETHLLDWSGDLYGQPMSLHFVKYLRPEQRFSGLPALIAQITQDVENARQILREQP